MIIANQLASASIEVKNYLPFWIGLRYIRSRKNQRFLSLLSWVSLLGMILGVCALIVVLSVMNGFQAELRGRLLNVMPHITAVAMAPLSHDEFDHLKQSLSAGAEVEHISPLISGEALLSGGNRLRAVELQAIKPEENRIQQHIIAGNWQAFTEMKYGIVLGASLARSLGLALDDKVTVILPQVTYTPFGPKPRIKQFRLRAVFEVGADVDSSMAFIRFADGNKLYGLKGKIPSFQIITQDILQAEALAHEFDNSYNNLKVSSWAEQRSQLFAAIKMEKMMVSFLLSLVILVAAFNLLAVLSMMVAEKRLDISVLRVLGLSRGDVLVVFLAQGMSLAIASLVVGSVIGVVLALNLTDIVRWLEQATGLYVFDPSVFYITGLPSVLLLWDVVNIAIFSLLLSIVFCLYPAYRASTIEPIESMRV